MLDYWDNPLDPIIGEAKRVALEKLCEIAEHLDAIREGVSESPAVLTVEQAATALENAPPTNPIEIGAFDEIWEDEEARLLGLVAEELFASGCQLLISMTSSGLASLDATDRSSTLPGCMPT